MRIELLHDVGNDLKGAVIVADDRRAQRLIATGYATAVVEDVKPGKGTRCRKD